MKAHLKFETLAIKSTENQLQNTQALSTPIYLSSTYKRNEDGSYNEDLIYSRNDNPNRKIVEQSIAALENGKHCFAFSSGMASINSIFQCLKTGDHVVLPNDIYYAIKKLMDQIFIRWGLEYSLVDMTNLESVQSAIKENTALIWIETPSNPQLKISDIQAIVSISRKNNVLCVVDNTWATPVYQNPLNLGVDIVMHSATKYFGGHSDVVGGCVVLNNDELAEKLQSIQVLSGAVPSPFDCWLISRGIQTLHLRISKQAENAMALATYLEQHPAVEKVNYPGLQSHEQHEIALKQQPNGFGAMLSVCIGGNEQKAFEVSTKLQLFTSATSLGGVESLVEHRKSVEGPASPTPENLLRVSMGIEHITDLIADWEQALI